MKGAVIAVLAALLSGCGLFGRDPVPEVRYTPVPEGLLQPCAVPALPATNGEMSVAFAAAALCADQGNKDKARIRALVAPAQD